MTDYWHWERAYGTTSVNVKEAFSENFNTDQFSNVDTLVREAIQNILDAEADQNVPVEVDFSFGQSSDPLISELFSTLSTFRSHCPNIPSRDFSNIRWLLIKDSKTTGLKGTLQKRRGSDFWKYWMNCGSGSKASGNLGRHGVGRVSVILGSKVHTIIGATLRKGEENPVLSGISLLDNTDYDGKERSSTSLLVKDFLPDDDIYQLHSQDVVNSILQTFGIKFDSPGLALIVIDPRDEITTDRIKAAIIEHFASAIIKGTLKASISGELISPENIIETARGLSDNFQIRNMTEDFESYLSLISDLHNDEMHKHRFELNGPQRIRDFEFASEKIDECRSQLNECGKVLFEFVFPLGIKKKDSIENVDCTFKVGFSKPTVTKKGVETYHRKGMSIPNGPQYPVLNGMFTAAITAADRELATLLNVCEGKAHLSWSSSTQVEEELNKKYVQGMKVRNMCALSLKDINLLLSDSGSELDLNFWDEFFSAPIAPDESTDSAENDDFDEENEVDEEDYLKAQLYKYSEIRSGFEVEGNPDFDFEGRVLSFRVTVAYESEGADSFKLWDKDDFDLQSDHKMTNFQNCTPSWRSGNEFDVTVGRPDFKLSVKGFDLNRELAVKIYRLR